MGLTQKQLQTSKTILHGIVPVKSARPIGKIYLETDFGNAENLRSEIISFEVVNLESPYHAILGRLAYARFMALPCYVYLKLEKSGPYGPICSVRGTPWCLVLFVGVFTFTLLQLSIKSSAVREVHPLNGCKKVTRLIFSSASS